jgi:carbon-monoxide dehydrogenase medium subunit
MRSGASVPEVIVDLGGLGELSYIRNGDDKVSIGALTTISELVSSAIIRDRSPLLSAAAGRLGNSLTRNRATIGGNLADASPAADMAPPLLAMGASVHIRKEGEEGRSVPLDAFFLGPNQTVLDEDEVITEITFPTPKNEARTAHIKLGLRDSMAISVVSIAVMLEMEGKVCRKARLALGAVAPKPIRAKRVEELLEGREIDSGLIDQCVSLVKEEISPIGDIRASARYRELVTSVLFKRAIHEVLS